MNAKRPSSNPLTGKTITGPVSARMTIDGRSYINFYGSGYLALSDVPDVRAAVLRAMELGASFAQHIPAAAFGAVDPLFDAVECAAAAASGTEASVYFSSGYLIGAIGLASLQGYFDAILLDELAHYNLSDAATMSGVPVHRYAHCDAQSLRETLKLSTGRRPLIVTDGVFAVTGRVPPLKDYASVLEPYEGRFFIDDAHSFGVVGENGRGAAELCGVETLATSAATLSKALCAHGAFIGCSVATARRLRGIPQIRGTCAGSPLSATAATASLQYIARHPELRARLREMTAYLRARLRRVGFEVIDSPAPIVAFKAGNAEEMLTLQRRVFEQGIYLIHATNYVGCGPEGVLRCAVFRDHSQADIDALISALS